MSFSRSRYVAVCQQMLAAGTVFALGLTAAGVMTLDIVAPDGGALGSTADMAPAVHVRPSYVDTRPITPVVHDVAVPRTAPTPPGAPHGTSARVAPRTAVVTTAPQPVSGFATVGVTWSRAAKVPAGTLSLRVRTEKGGVWSRWHDLESADSQQSDGEGARVRPGTDPLVIGRVDRVQLRAASSTGSTPVGMQLAVIDPGKDTLTKQAPAIDTAKLPTSDESATGAPIESTTGLPDATQPGQSGRSGDVALTAMKVAPKPQIFSRAQWGANEKLREQGKPDYGTIKTGFIHHTVNANNYHKRDVPALIRGIYAYHVISRGWRDIGYNFLVDRFGRIWEGRYGGVDRPVIGAHTLGFNDVSFAMSAIGNFQIARPPQAVLDAYARLFAWKLSMYNIKADASGLHVHGVVLHAINGHRDVEQTACPGKYLYAKIPDIRVAAAKIQRRAQHGDGSPPPPPPTSSYQPMARAAQAPPQPSGMHFPASADVTGSHWPDLVLQKADGSISVRRLGGMVGYRAPVTSAGPWSAMSKIVASGDLTGDHRGDVLAKRKRTAGWLLFPGKGNGHVASRPVDQHPLVRHLSQVVAAGDWNHDGHADLLGIDRDNHALYLLRGASGAGQFQHRVRLARGWDRFTRTVVAGDLNRDGRPDVVALGKDHQLYASYGRGPASITAPQVVSSLGSSYDDLTSGGDLTGDGVGDVMVHQAGTDQSVILRGNGNGGFAAYPDGPFAGMGGLQQVSAAQLTGGPRADLLARSNGKLVVRANNERTNLLPGLSSQRTTQATSAIYSVGDWNQDGKPDVITRQRDGHQLVLNRGLGNGKFGPGVSMSLGWGKITRLTAVGDVTGDGYPDLMGKSRTGVMRIFPGNGKTGFLPPLKANATMRTFNVVGGDTWNTQQLPGSVLSSSDRSFVPFAGADSGAAMRTAGDGGTAQYDWLIGPGDVNGDGRPDLLGRQRSDGSLWLIPGTATGFGQRQFVGSGLGKYRLAG